MKRNRTRRDQLDLERELRAGRPQPRADFIKALADEVRSRPTPQRRPLGRVGLALALSGLIVVALASFGGVGYASSAARQVVKKVERGAPAKHPRVVTKSAAQAQYGPFTPPTPKPKPNAAGTGGAGTTGPTGASGAAGAGAGAKGQNSAPKVTTSQLPFTGLTLWMPLPMRRLVLSFRPRLSPPHWAWAWAWAA
jgi:hypothetical protein